MRVRTFAPLIAAAVVVGTWTGPAHAGGGWWSWIEIDAPHVGVGERVLVTSDLMFASEEAAKDARDSDDYEVYLLRGVDWGMVRRATNGGTPGDWWTPPDRMWHVGDVRLDRFRSNVADAASRVTIPVVSPGQYALMFCTASCAEPLANVIPQRVRVSPDAELAAQVRRLTARKWELMHSAALSKRRAARARKEVRDLSDALEVQTRRSEDVREIEERVSELTATVSEDGSDGGGPEVAAALAAGLLLGALGGIGLRRARGIRSAAGPPGEPAAARR